MESVILSILLFVIVFLLFGKIVSDNNRTIETLEMVNTNNPRLNSCVNTCIRNNPEFAPATTPRPSTTNPTSQNNNAPITSSNMWVTEHNRVRRDVGQAPVAWDENLANGATQYAQQLSQNPRCNLVHSAQQSRTSGSTILGENLAFASSSANNVTDLSLFRLWENEKAQYRYPAGPSSAVGHYTQIVNRNVKQIGCGCSKCGANGKICVCRYNPIQSGGPPY